MDIAKEVASKPDEKMPDYLTKQEEETVKELVKTLRASNLAMKTYVQAMVYNDSLRKQIEIQNQLADSLRRVSSNRQLAGTKWNQWMQVCKAIKANQAKLTSSEKQAVSRINRFIDESQEKIMRLFIKNGISPGSAFIRQGKEASTNHQTYNYLGILKYKSGTFRDSLIYSEGVNKAGWTLMRLKDNLRQTNPSLASAAEFMQSKLTSAQDLLMLKYGLPSDDVNNTLRMRSKMANRALKSSIKEVEQTHAELNEQTKVTEIESERTLAMGKWYIVAAMAETFIELGQNLAY
jgi:hypothetical protein